jgi:hypothetical protein
MGGVRVTFGIRRSLVCTLGDGERYLHLFHHVRLYPVSSGMRRGRLCPSSPEDMADRAGGGVRYGVGQVSGAKRPAKPPYCLTTTYLSSLLHSALLFRLAIYYIALPVIISQHGWAMHIPSSCEVLAHIPYLTTQPMTGPYTATSRALVFPLASGSWRPGGTRWRS